MVSKNSPSPARLVNSRAYSKTESHSSKQTTPEGCYKANTDISQEGFHRTTLLKRWQRSITKLADYCKSCRQRFPNNGLPLLQMSMSPPQECNTSKKAPNKSYIRSSSKILLISHLTHTIEIHIVIAQVGMSYR